MNIQHSLYIPQYLLVSLLAWALHYTYFHSNLAPHFTGVLRALGWKRGDYTFWSPESLETRIYDDWFTWLHLHNTIPPRVAELLTCPTCLSWHYAGWSALPVFILLGPREAAQVFTLTLILCLRSPR